MHSARREDGISAAVASRDTTSADDPSVIDLAPARLHRPGLDGWTRGPRWTVFASLPNRECTTQQEVNRRIVGAVNILGAVPVRSPSDPAR
jgi:hypothetical protein